MVAGVWPHLVVCALLLSAQRCAAAPAADGAGDDERARQAVRLKGQSDTFRLRAGQYHVKHEQEVERARRIRAQATKMRLKALSLEKAYPVDPARYQTMVKNYLAHIEEYRQLLAAFHNHAEERARQDARCARDLALYRQHCAEYTRHADRYHHGMYYPHVCPPMQASHEGLDRVAAQFTSDLERVRREDGLLRQEEQLLRKAEMDRLDRQRRVVIDLAGRLDSASARQIAAAYARLEAEYASLEAARAHIAAPAGRGK